MFAIVRTLALALGLVSFVPAAFAFQETPTEPAQEDEAEAELAEEDPLAGVDLVPGPLVGELNPRATIQVPEGLVFANRATTQQLMEMMQNPVSDTELGLVGAPDLDWFVLFEFDEMGYVDDEDKDELDADELLETLKEGNAASNEARAERGWSTLELLGWSVPPHYDPQSNNLEWATRAKSSEGHVTVNHNSRVLGRHGVTVVTLVCSDDQHAGLLPTFHELLKGFDYRAGQRYSEYTSGDKVAKYGLTALVAGGAGALAVKSGLLGKLWKPIAVALVAIGAFFKKIFGGKKKETAPSRPSGKPDVAANDAGDQPPAAQ